MLYCNNCQKEVVIYGLSNFPGAQEAAEEMRQYAEADGKLMLFNPPSFGPYTCPSYFQELEERNE